jgi:2-phospho-L-lactate guanylyltransferase (CobY/MobA/RfbA family)
MLMGKLKEAILVLVVLVLTSTIAQAVEKCVNTQGEALIIKSDVPAAKMEAVARAKWAAIEQVVGTAVKAQSFVQNFVLVEGKKL